MTTPPARPHVTWRAFSAPKAGNRPEEMEDAFAANAGLGRFAVADGASESALAGGWARLLADFYVQTTGCWSRWLPASRERWQEQCPQGDLPWYVEEKIADGASATLLGLSFCRPHRWQATAVGDSCLFHVRQGRLVRAFPVQHSTDFGNQPPLLCSQVHYPRQRLKRCRLRRGEWTAGDYLLLMTDALAQWFLHTVEKGGMPWQDCLRLADQQEFAAWLQGIRKAGNIRNDDVTLLLVETTPA